jgi:hypothetical protein
VFISKKGSESGINYPKEKPGEKNKKKEELNNNNNNNNNLLKKLSKIN